MTHADLSRLLQHEVRETFSFLTREVDTSDLDALSWWRRYPRALVRFFLAVAYRLSPWRRVLFAASMIALGLAWLGFALGLAVAGPFSLDAALPGPHLAAGGRNAASRSCSCSSCATSSRSRATSRSRARSSSACCRSSPGTRTACAIATAMRPANTVGGDYFDVIELGGGRIAVAVGDVAGKGMPAALLMALLQGSLRTLVSAGLRGSELMAKLNAHLCANIPSNRLITLLYAELDPATGHFSYVNAGHNPPFLLQAGHPPARLGATAIALGITTDAEFVEMTLELDPGDRLVLYTDGITEAEDASDREYGDARLGAWLQASREQPGRALIDGVIAEVLEHCGSARPRDDMTLMCLERVGEERSSAAPPAPATGRAVA